MRIKLNSRWVGPVLAGLAFFSFQFAPTVLADSNDRLANLQINVWPEYDDARVLVMYDGEVADTTSLPRNISILIPSTASLTATAYVDANGSFINVPDAPTTQDTGDGFSRVTVKLPAAKFHLEYYYNPLQGSPDKTMEFVYKAAQATGNVQIEIQQPLKADKFATDPATPVHTTDAHNFTFYVFNYASLDAGQEQKVKISYTKTDPNPSVSNIPQPASAPQPAAAASNSSIMSLLPPVMIAVALALAALGGFALWSRGRNSLEPAPARVESPKRRTRRGGASGFCVQCGRALTADDNFCPRCGTRRRSG